MKSAALATTLLFSTLQVSYAQDDSAAVGIIVAAVLAACVGLIIVIILPYCMFGWLKAEDAYLPPNRKYMNGKMCCLYWLICCCCGLMGSVVFYIQASNQIAIRRLVIDGITEPDLLKGNSIVKIKEEVTTFQGPPPPPLQA